MNRAPDAKWYRNQQGKDRSHQVEENCISHWRFDDVNGILLTHLGIAKISLQQTIYLAAFLIWGKAHPTQVTQNNGVIQTHFISELLVHLLVYLGLQLLFHRLQPGPSRI